MVSTAINHSTAAKLCAATNKSFVSSIISCGDNPIQGENAIFPSLTMHSRHSTFAIQIVPVTSSVLECRGRVVYSV
jgi:hypothetical protein